MAQKTTLVPSGIPGQNYSGFLAKTAIAPIEVVSVGTIYVSANEGNVQVSNNEGTVKG